MVAQCAARIAAPSATQPNHTALASTDEINTHARLPPRGEAASDQPHARRASRQLALCEPTGRERATGAAQPSLERQLPVQPGRPLPIPIHQGFTGRPRRGNLVPRPGAGGPTTPRGRTLQAAQRLLLGSPIPTVREAAQCVNKIIALAVLSSNRTDLFRVGGPLTALAGLIVTTLASALRHA